MSRKNLITPVPRLIRGVNWRQSPNRFLWAAKVCVLCSGRIIRFCSEQEPSAEGKGARQSTPIGPVSCSSAREHGHLCFLLTMIYVAARRTGDRIPPDLNGGWLAAAPLLYNSMPSAGL